MTLLVISPDYASHLFPLATLATAWQDAGERVVVATGSATDRLVRSFGFERVPLQLGRGSNPGVIRAEEQPRGEDEVLRGFFAATRAGAVPTLEYQAAARDGDLLWRPLELAREVQRVVDEVRPEQVIVDHLAFSARLALLGSGIDHADVVLGHPTAVTVGDEVYGCPPVWPRRLQQDPAALARLRRCCEDVRDAFTEQWNTTLAQLDPQAPASDDAFAETGDRLLLNYPDVLHPPQRSARLGPHTFLGSAVRREAPDPEVVAWVEADPTPIVYVSLGSFLSVRADVLARIAEALRTLPVRVALARGSAPREALGDLPSTWLVRDTLPQVTLLGASALCVTHGGNNSVTEALTAGVPLLVLPLSTDQFVGAAAVEDAGFGEALDPNAATPRDLAEAAARLLDLDPEPARRLAALSRDLRDSPGALVAYTALTTPSALPVAAPIPAAT